MPELYDYTKDGGPEGKTYDDFYLKLRRDVRAWVAKHTKSDIADVLLNVPDFFYLLVKLANDPDVPNANRRQIVAAVIYFVSPLDVIPDVIPGLGWLDDLYLALIVIDGLMNAVDLDVIEKYWLGDEDIIHMVKLTLDRLNDKLGAGLIKRIIDSLHKNKDPEVYDIPDSEDFDSYVQD